MERKPTKPSKPSTKRHSVAAAFKLFILPLEGRPRVTAKIQLIPPVESLVQSVPLASQNHHRRWFLFKVRAHQS